MEVYELIQSLAGAGSNYEIRILDGERKYKIDSVHTDNGYVEINILVKEDRTCWQKK